MKYKIYIYSQSIEKAVAVVDHINVVHSSYHDCDWIVVACVHCVEASRELHKYEKCEIFHNICIEVCGTLIQWRRRAVICEYWIPCRLLHRAWHKQLTLSVLAIQRIFLCSFRSFRFVARAARTDNVHQYLMHKQCQYSGWSLVSLTFSLSHSYPDHSQAV